MKELRFAGKGLCEKCNKIRDVFVYGNHSYCIKHLRPILKKNNDVKSLIAIELWELKEMKKKVLEKEKSILNMLKKEAIKRG